MDPLLISLVSAATALVASILGPLVTLAVARRQFNASVLSANRQKWIETLRDLLAELISLLVTALVVKENWQGSWERGGHAAVAGNSELLAKLERIVLVQNKIRLLLNPSEDDHIHLYRTIDVAFKRIRDEGPSDKESEADIDTIIKLSQAILKREWQRVKAGL